MLIGPQSSAPYGTDPAVAVLELSSVARGYRVADALVKRATVTIRRAEPIEPGKYLLVFSGPVGEVEEAYDAGVAESAGTLLDRLCLPQVEPRVVLALSGTLPGQDIDAIAVVECFTVASAIVGLDDALKAAEVRPVDLRLAQDLEGKGLFVLTGELVDIEAAVDAAKGVITGDAMVEIVARPHADFVDAVLRPRRRG